MGSVLSNKYKKKNLRAVTDVNKYVNCEDIKTFNIILQVFFSDKLSFNARESLRHNINALDKDFDILFWLNVKDDDKFKYSYLINLLIICVSLLNYELQKTSKHFRPKSIHKLIYPVANRLTFTLKQYSFFIQLHYNSVKIQRWWRGKLCL